MMPALMLVRSPDTHHVPSLIHPGDGPMVVGRAPQSVGGVAVADSSMSREHFRVFFNESGQLQVEDLNSTNGVLLGDRMLRSDAAELPVGEVMRAGDSIWVAVSQRALISEGFFVNGGEEWVGYSARLLEFKERLEVVQGQGTIWLTGWQCRRSQLKVARALASHRGLKLQVDGDTPDEGTLWFTTVESVGKHHENTVIGATGAREAPTGFQELELPRILTHTEDRLLLFEDVAHRWSDEVLYRSVNIPYSLFRWGSCSELSEFESVIQSMIQTLRPMEVLDDSHLEIAGVAVVSYGAGEKRMKPNRDELTDTLVAKGGSVRATAAHYEVQRTQVYRWIRSYSINMDELRKN